MKTLDTAKEPEYANPGDAGADLRSVESVRIPAGGRALVNTGISAALPEGTVAMVCPRSGLAVKNGITVLNAPGIIDSGYRGEWGVVLLNTSHDDFDINVGDKIAQVVLVPFISGSFVHVDELDSTERGSGGFGSTGS